MTTDTIKIHRPKIDLRNSGFLLVATGILLCWTLIRTGDSPSPTKIWQFIMQYIGFTAYVLMPMTVFVLGTIILLITESIDNGSAWARGLQRTEVTAPILGIIGTFVGAGLALKTLGSGAMTGDAIFLVIGQIGTCIWSTVIGMVVGISAHILVEDGVRGKVEGGNKDDVPTRKNPACKTGLHHEPKAHRLAKKYKTESGNSYKRTRLPVRTSAHS